MVDFLTISFRYAVLFLSGILLTCSAAAPDQTKQAGQDHTVSKKDSATALSQPPIVVGANRTKKYLPFLKGKKVGIVGNQTSVIFKSKTGYTHLVDSLVHLNVDVTKVFSPEHGFRGTAAAGETVKNGIDRKTGLPIISLYGPHKKPTPEDLKNVDLLIFDIQDVGVRFYTYISTLHYVMDACAENGIPLLILDRPNPNGTYIDGPILEADHRSFVGMDPVPIVHGMTIGEYAKMINGEGWLKDGETCDLKVVKMKNYTKSRHYSLPIKPSPNLPNDTAINLYPSLCFFEGTNVNAGRGTDFQFQVFGSPKLNSDYFDFHYTPMPNAGAKHPKNEGQRCYGRDLRQTERLYKIDLHWLIEAYRHTDDQAGFFSPFFEKLAGTDQLRRQIKEGLSPEDIRQSWESGLQIYDERRKAYLLYPAH